MHIANVFEHKFAKIVLKSIRTEQNELPALHSFLYVGREVVTLW